ncbi:aminotransferase class I/II-fold pyridoxal phosphate-dependent enzyme [Streptomyces sp. NPDC048637]|uniref:MalY/PatB family protein n=1 Tax=Streptomyces sp. NPDC048637 TaxID=3155636 RepID=UPI003438D3FB
MTALDRAGADLPTVTGGLKWTRHAPDVLAAWVAEMDYATAPPIRDAIEAAVRRGAFGYPDDRSRQDLVTACADWLGRTHGWQVAPEQVYVLPDVLHGVQVAIEEHSPAGSPVILPVPGYPPLADAVRVCRRPLFEVPMTSADGRPTLDLDAVDRAFAAGARTLVLCNPHNPLGTVAEPHELHAVAAVVDRHGGRVVADEIHSPLVFPGHRHVPYAALSKTAADHTVTLVAASKGWNIAGLKCAQAIVTHERDRAIWSALPTVRTWGAGLFGVVASEAAYRLGGPWLTGVLRALDVNRRLLADLLDELLPAVRYRLPEGTYLAWLDFRCLGLPEEPAEFLLRESKVALSAGRPFGESGAGHARLNLATSPRILERLVRAMAETAGKRR